MKRIRRWFHYAIGATAGAGLAYLFDPEQGRSRRARLKDQAQAQARRTRGQAEARARYAAGEAKGRVAEVTGRGRPSPADDRVTADLVRQSLAALTFPTSDVTVEVVDGWATLRGQVEATAQIEAVVEATRSTPGVVDVGSYLHLPGQPAPNKEQALRAS